MPYRIPIVDTDTHITEPPDVWVDRMSRRWGNLVPHVAWDESSGTDSWFVGDHRITGVAMSWRVGWDEPYPSMPRTLADVAPAAYDAAARVAVMDEMGVRVATPYPNLAFVGFDIFGAVDVEEFRLECVRAYNDWLLDWISAFPDRFVPLACVPYWDVEASVREIERCAANGHKGLISTGAPHLHGQPFLADHHWDPVWAAAQAHRMPISFHTGGGDMTTFVNEERLRVEGSGTMIARGTTQLFFGTAQTLTDLLLSGVLARFPDLRFLLVESGIGWIPFCLETVDHLFLSNHISRERPEFESLPSEYFARQVFANYYFEQLTPSHVERVGLGNILFETDYPHASCLEDGADVERVIHSGLSAMPEDVQHRILWRNAAELYGLDLGPTGAGAPV